jgi:hypothetical protein
MVEREGLTREWTLPSGHHVRFLPDGTTVFAPPGADPARSGSWRYVGDGRFETVEVTPPPRGRGHNPGGYDDLAHDRATRAGDGRIGVAGFEGGEEGLERDPVVWSRVGD